ncbi:hypothetical protein ABT288_31610 [Streptomyces sp. NPDC001093]|uniref:hypothetical protein n=1 Tax=Streptomyces sp. NPDC001093 TaxID=3154376 RepID=UPI0033336FB4
MRPASATRCGDRWRKSDTSVRRPAEVPIAAVFGLGPWAAQHTRTGWAPPTTGT